MSENGDSLPTIQYPKPSVGRAVHYYPDHRTDPHSDASYDGPYHATITKVWSDRCVNLMVSPPWVDGVPFAVTSVDFSEPSDPNQPVRKWTWPPRV